jgi:hypothetical protein
LHRGTSLCKRKGERAGGSRKPTLCSRAVLMRLEASSVYRARKNLA